MSNSSSDKDRALATVLGRIEKNYGKGAIMILGERKPEPLPVISSGAFSIDYCLGVGGYPRGRIIEIYGPEASGKTTLALHAIAEAQHIGGVAAFIDAEHALDLNYAQNLGVNTGKLLLSQPDYGEQALNIVEELVISNALDIIVVDSVAALVPRAEIEGEMGDSQMGLHARLMSQAMRKLAGIVDRSKAVLIFINQLRSKIGVVFGCFSGDNVVSLADGSKACISRLVADERPGLEVFSYDVVHRCVKPSIVDTYYNNGVKSYFWKIVAESVGGYGPQELKCTLDHMIPTTLGDKKACDIVVGDKVYHKVERCLNKAQQLLMVGSLLGNGNIGDVHQNIARYREECSSDQYVYLKFKRDLLAANVSKKIYKRKNLVFLDSKSTFDFFEYSTMFYRNEKKVLPKNIDKVLDHPLALAIWYMDAGALVKSRGRSKDVSYSYCAIIASLSFTKLENLKLISILRNNFGILAKLVLVPARGGAGYCIWLSPAATKKFSNLIAPYVMESMQYKLLIEDRNRFDKQQIEVLQGGTPKLGVAPVKVIASQRASSKYDHSSGYDLQVDSTSNYFVSDILVHNSPEITTGGNALKFYATIRIDVRRVGALKDGVAIRGNRTKVKIVKNKVASPFKEVELDLIYGKGISRIGDIIDRAVDVNVIIRSGAWYSYGERKFQGKSAVEAALLEDGALYKQVFDEVYKVYFPTAPLDMVAASKGGEQGNGSAAVDVSNMGEGGLVNTMIVEDSELNDVL